MPGRSSSSKLQPCQAEEQQQQVAPSTSLTPPSWPSSPRPPSPASRRVPTKIKNFVGLTSRSCTPEGAQEAVGEKDINLMKQQLPGWKVRRGAERLQRWIPFLMI